MSIQLPWIEKYRPKNLDEIIDHGEKIEVLRRLMTNNELPHLLFYGSPGTGKTSLILACAREMYGSNYRQYILELNASDHRGIDIVRTIIPDFVKTRSDKLRLVILDEVDAMTGDAQSALRRVMENYVKNSRFCLICNNITRIIPGIQSRCARMRFGLLKGAEIRKKVEQIVKLENVAIEDSALDVLVNLNGDFRQVLNTLQCLHYINSESGSRSSGSATESRSSGSAGQSRLPITSAEIYEYLGRPSPEEVDAVYNQIHGGFHTVYSTMLEMLRENRWNLIDMISGLCQRVIKDDKISEDRRTKILCSLSEIESRVINGRESELQLASLISAFN